MSKHLHLLLWVPLVFAVFFLMYFYRIIANEYVEFEEFVLNKQANYASESAVQEMLYVGDMESTYTSPDEIKLDPDYALNDFVDIMCRDYGLNVTDTVRENLKNNNVKVLAVCVNDGVYLYYSTRSEDHKVELKCTPKLPYSMTQGDTQYILTLNPDKGWYAKKGTENGHPIYKRSNKVEYNTDPNVSRPATDVQLTSINDYVADLLNYGLFNSYMGNDRIEVELPAIANHVKGAQPVDKVTVIGVVEGDKRLGTSVAVAECIGGAQITEADTCVGYTLKNIEINGTVYNGNYYAYQSWWARHGFTINNSETVTGPPKHGSADAQVIEHANGKYFDNAYAAASAGYNSLNLVN